MLSRHGSDTGVESEEVAEIRRRLAALEQRLEALERAPSASETSFGLNRLSETERRIATLVAAGRTNEEVGERLFLSPKTVEWSLTKIYRKLRVRSRTELAARLTSAASIRGNSGETPGRALPGSSRNAEEGASHE